MIIRDFQTNYIPFHCKNADQFKTIYEDLNKYKTEGHEDIAFEVTNQGEAIPLTAEKEVWYLRLWKWITWQYPDQSKIDDFVIEFFQANEEYLKEMAKNDLTGWENQMRNLRFSGSSGHQTLYGLRHKIIGAIREQNIRAKEDLTTTARQSYQNALYIEGELQTQKELKRTQAYHATSKRKKQIDTLNLWNPLTNVLTVKVKGEKEITIRADALAHVPFFNKLYGGKKPEKDFELDLSKYSEENVKLVLTLFATGERFAHNLDLKTLLELHDLALEIGDQTLAEEVYWALWKRSEEASPEMLLNLIKEPPRGNPVSDQLHSYFPLESRIYAIGGQRFKELQSLNGFADLPHDKFIKLLEKIPKTDFFQARKGIENWIRAEMARTGQTSREILEKSVNGKYLINLIPTKDLFAMESIIPVFRNNDQKLIINIAADNSKKRFSFNIVADDFQQNAIYQQFDWSISVLQYSTGERKVEVILTNKQNLYEGELTGVCSQQSILDSSTHHYHWQGILPNRGDPNTPLHFEFEADKVYFLPGWG